MHPNADIVFKWEDIPGILIDRPPNTSQDDWRIRVKANFEKYVDAVDSHNALVDAAVLEMQQREIHEGGIAHDEGIQRMPSDASTCRPLQVKCYKVPLSACSKIFFC